MRCVRFKNIFIKVCEFGWNVITTFTVQNIGWTLREQKRLRQLFQKLTVSLLHKWVKRSLFMHCSASFTASLIACLYRNLQRNLSTFISPHLGLPIDVHKFTISMHCFLMSSNWGDHQCLWKPTLKVGTHNTLSQF